MKNLKTLGVFLTLLVLLTSSALAVTQFGSPNYSLIKVSVNDIDASPANTVFMERGSTADVKVWFTGGNQSSTVNSARVKVWLGGYEFGDIEHSTDVFQIEPGVSYLKDLSLNIPADLDGSKTYTLHVQVLDDVNSLEEVYNLRVKEVRHQMQIEDVLFTPDNLQVEAGNNLMATVRVKNTGDKNEQDVKVQLNVPKLGLSTRTYIDELYAHPVAGSNEDNSQSSEPLLLKLPNNVQAGNYDAIVEVDYNSGHDSVTQTFPLQVTNNQAVAQATNTLVNVDAQSKDVVQGQGAVYKLSFANLDSTAKQYNVEVTGTDNWATSKVDPAVLTVQSGSTADASVYINASQNADLGAHSFTVKVSSNGNELKEITLSSNVTQNASAWDAVKTALKWAFFVLLAVLVVLGIALGIKKSRSSDETEEPSALSGQTYYFYPKL